MLSLWVGLHPHPGSGRVFFCSAAAAAGAAEALSSSTVATVTARPQTADHGMHDIAITDHFIVKSDAVLTLRKVGCPALSSLAANPSGKLVAITLNAGPLQNMMMVSFRRSAGKTGLGQTASAGRPDSGSQGMFFFPVRIFPPPLAY